jgi:hypothetical protein
MNVWVNDYTDVQGRDTGRLLSISPGLHIVLDGQERNCKPLHNVGKTCGKCKHPIRGRNLFPAPEDTRVLACDCLMVLFKRAAFEPDWVIKNWRIWRRMKAGAEAQLASGKN